MPILGIVASSQQSAFISTGAYESIATLTVGAGGSAGVAFTSIPATYTHLQIRGIVKCTNDDDDIGIRLNSDTGSNYSTHRFYGGGTSTGQDGYATNTQLPFFARSGSGTSSFGVTVYDILDYTNTNKYTTTRGLFGQDANGSGYIMYAGGSWRNTSAITTIDIIPSFSNFVQYTQFALYGIKGA
jgi:hypothetical protein